jgi:hypothetical protein
MFLYKSTSDYWLEMLEFSIFTYRFETKYLSDKRGKYVEKEKLISMYFPTIGYKS